MAKDDIDGGVGSEDTVESEDLEFDIESILKEFSDQDRTAEAKSTPPNMDDTIQWSRKAIQGTEDIRWGERPSVVQFQSADPQEALKNDLIQGPEKRYYALAQVGVNRLQAAMFLNLLILVLSAGGVVLYAAGMVQLNRLRLLIVGEIFSMMCSGILGCYQLAYGLRELFCGRFTPEALMLFSLIACLADSAVCLRELRLPYCCLFCLQMAMALWAEYDRRKTELCQMDVLRKADQLHGIIRVANFYEDRPGFLRGTGQVRDFMGRYRQRTGPDKAMSVYLLLAFACCTAASIMVGRQYRIELAIQVWAASLLVTMPVTSFLSTCHPQVILARRLHRLGTVICGWDGVQALCEGGSVPLSEEDLFPAGAVKMNGVKFFGSRDPGQMMAYAAALIEREGGGLAPLFRQLVDSHSGARYSVKNLRSYTNGGIGGEINREPVLMGTQRFLRDMGVEMPEGTRVHQAVYLAVEGTLCGVFAISYNRHKDVAAGLNALYGYRNLTPVLLTSDFMVTSGFLRDKFGGNAVRIVCPTRSVREALAAKRPGAGDPVCALVTKEHLNSMAYTITGARSLRYAMRTGVLVHVISGILGMMMVLALVHWGSMNAVSTVNLLAYQLALMIPGLLLPQWARNL